MKKISWQFTGILLCFLLTMLDGMYVMVVSYAAPAISKSWAVTPQSLGIVFSAGLLGMSIGAMVIAPRADKFGRKNIIILCTIIMSAGTFATAWVSSVNVLMFMRVLSGLGIGGVLASAATLTAEYAPKGKKDFWISFVMSGYPVGAVLSGFAAGSIIPQYGWQYMFKSAGIISALVLPLVYLFLKESDEFLQKDSNKKSPSVAELLTPEIRKPTLWLWLAIFMAFATLYFLTSWIPKLVAASGLSPEDAIYAGAIFNMGAFAGIVSQGYLSATFGLQKTIFCYLVFTAALMVLFGFIKGSLFVLILFGLIGFGIQGGFVGMYSLAARLYPVEKRATGVGWAVGAGRIGAITGPLIGGLLIGWGFSMAANFIGFALTAIIGAIATLFVTTRQTNND